MSVRLISPFSFAGSASFVGEALRSESSARDWRACGAIGLAYGQSERLAPLRSLALAQVGRLGSGIGHWLGFRVCVAVIRARWECRFANKSEMATPRKPSDYF
jgi:hypothetical protein